MAVGIMFLLFVGFLVVLAAVLVGLRNWGHDYAAAEARLLSPQTHSVAYVVPEGQDPAVLMAALSRAGFDSVVDAHGPFERLLVECEKQNRDEVRRIIEHVHRTGFDGLEMHVAHVSFEDER